MQSGTCIHTLRGHNDEILDVSFNATGSKLVTASADGNSRVYNTMTGACHAILAGHEGEISKVAFNPQGTRILTASSDKTARIWETETGDCLQVSACVEGGYLISYIYICCAVLCCMWCRSGKWVL